jgi:peptidoglycan/LPS O-acetylase OafA/YrhL
VTTQTTAARLRAWLTSLRRITTSGRYFPEIDGLRFVAIFSVVFFHVYAQTRKEAPLPPVLDTFISHGDRGVRLFFAISGFILALPFCAQFHGAHRKVDLKRYFLRRLTRLEPPYLLSLVAAALMEVAFKHQLFDLLWPHLLASALYLHNLIYGTMSVINSVAWSLEVEVQFYCVLPLLVWIFAIRPHWLRWSVLAVTICAVGMLDLTLTSARLQNSLVNYLPYFLAGLLLADVYTIAWAKIPAGWWWDAMAVPLWVLIFYAPAWWLGFVIPVLIFFAYLASLKSRYLSLLLRRPLVTVLGGACYSIYLVHFLVIGFAFHATRHIAVTASPTTYYFIQASLLIPISVICGMIYYALIEQPCMYPDWPQRLLATLTTLLPTSAI